jgi:ABC-2 type transport system permease protein
MLQKFGYVFSFTLTQNFRGRGIRVVTFLFVAIALASMPVLHFFDAGMADETFPVETVYVLDETGLGADDFTALSDLNDKYRDTSFPVVSERMALSPNEMQLVISNSGSAFVLQFISAEKEGISEEEINKVIPDFTEVFNQNRMTKLDITAEQNEIMQAKTESKITVLDSEGNLPAVSESISENQYFSFLGLIVFLIFIIAFSSETVSNSVVMEKSNKLVESLILLTEPSVLISGKVAACLVTVMIQVVLIAASFIASVFLSREIYHTETLELPGQVTDFLAQTHGLSPAFILIAVMFLLVGVVFYAILAGLFGAAVSNMEDLATGMPANNMLLVVSAYAAIGLNLTKRLDGQYDLIEGVLSFVPITAPFIVPINLLSGQTSIWFAILSLAAQIVFVILLAQFVFKVYRAMLLYKGERLKIGKILRLSKERTVIK